MNIISKEIKVHETNVKLLAQNSSDFAGVFGVTDDTGAIMVALQRTKTERLPGVATVIQWDENVPVSDEIQEMIDLLEVIL